MNARITGETHPGFSLCGSPANQATVSLKQCPSSKERCGPLARVMVGSSLRRDSMMVMVVLLVDVIGGDDEGGEDGQSGEDASDRLDVLTGGGG